MLPFTTYNIPEEPIHKTPHPHQWLWIIVGKDFSAPEETLLQKICSALKADFQRDVFIHISNSHSTFLPSQHHQAKLIISFGVAPSQVGFWIDLNSPGHRLLNKSFFIYAPSLQDLDQSPTGKKHLWSSMQSFMESTF
jgi:hypothetical protein